MKLIYTLKYNLSLNFRSPIYNPMDVTALGRVTCQILPYSADPDFSSLITNTLATLCIYINP